MNYDYCTYLEIAGGDSATIYRAVMDVLEEYHVPLHKVIGLCSDGASTMRGVYRGVCTRLQNHSRASRNQARVESYWNMQIKSMWKVKCLIGGDILVLQIKISN